MEDTTAAVAADLGMTCTALRLRLTDARRAGLSVDAVCEALPADIRAEHELREAS